MQRRIVLIRKYDWLHRAWQSRSFATAGGELERQLKVLGLALDDTYHPVRVPGRIGPWSDLPAARGFDYARRGLIDTYAVRASFDDEEAVSRLRRDRGADVIGVFADPAVSVFPSPYCDDAAVGTAADVARQVGVPALRALGLTGNGVHVALVDTGIDGRSVPVAGGWAPVPGYVPGSAKPDHGTMVAYGVRIAAPDAPIYDYALLRTQAGTWAAFLSDAIAAFGDLIDKVRANPGRWVVNNSWGMFDRAEDAPIGSPENYSANPEHPFNQITGGLVAAGADVFFAAGNSARLTPTGAAARSIRGPARAFTVRTLIPMSSPSPRSPSPTGDSATRRRGRAGCISENRTWLRSATSKAPASGPWTAGPPRRAPWPRASPPRCASASPRRHSLPRSSRASWNGARATWSTVAGTTT